MPFLGTLFYFVVAPRYFPLPLIQAKLLAVAITTLFIPIVFYFLLKNLGKAESALLNDVQERKWPLFIYILLLGLNLYQILNIYNYPALYYFFVGILFSILSSFILSWFKVKVSLHILGLSGILMFVLALSIYYHLNLIYSIAFLIFALGLTATSRLQAKAHNWIELILGFLIGLIPQIIVLNYWL
jgi:hypothetical protein